MSSWVLQDFDVGEISCQLIEFSVEGHTYVMVFNRVDATRTQATISEKAEELGLDYRENSYEVKFDLKCNFESDNFFQRPEGRISVTGMRELGDSIKELLYFHYRNSNAEAYVCIAESPKLKRFYDRLVKIYTSGLDFNVRMNLGDEGLGYEITTPSYKGQSC